MHHHECGCEHHADRKESHHHHEGCGCTKHAHQHQIHGCGSHHHGYSPRRFPTREEKILEMESYLEQLKAETKGVEEHLAEMKKVEE